MPTRGVHGATTVDENTSEAILKETRRLLALLIHFNGIQQEDVASLIFSTTRDLTPNTRPWPHASWDGSTRLCSAGTKWMFPAGCHAVCVC